MSETNANWPAPELRFMQRAAELALENVHSGKGGPFGCVIVRDGHIVAEGTNHVLAHKDPTAHAEVVAIRNACQTLDHFQLDDCDVYTSCEPCPMCLGALYWARPRRVFYSNTKTDAKRIEFDDQFIYVELELPLDERKMPMVHLPVPLAAEGFEAWAKKQDKTHY